VKINLKSLYETYECDICDNEDESQQHILEYKELVLMHVENIKDIQYEKIFDGNFCEQLEIARIFKHTRKIKAYTLKPKMII
jgi:hypothetical protein